MMRENTRLLLVYNAESGIVNALKDAVWKLVSPRTYPCSLCALTYGAVSMHDEWRRFLDSLPVKVVFHHKDDFAAAYPGHAALLPAILIANGNVPLRVLVSKDELDAIENTYQLMEYVEERLIDDQIRRPRLKIVA